MAVSDISYFSNSIQTPMPEDFDLYRQDASPRYAVGYKVELVDGRVFRYSHFGAAVARPGMVVSTTVSESATVENNITTVAPGSSASGSDGTAGSRYIEGTMAAITKDQFAGGYLTVIAGTGRGYTYRIKGNTVTGLPDGPASGNFRLELNDKVQATLTAVSDINVIGCKYANLKGATANTDEVPAGVTMRAMTANYYGWIQAAGIGLALVSATTTSAIGDILVLAAINNTAEAGAVATMGQHTTSTSIVQLVTEPIVGTCIQTVTTAADGCYVGINLMLE
jgi:hypothetical protein